jgi:hypothetical protein
VRVLQPPASFPYCPRRGTLQGLQTVRCASMRLKRKGRFTVASSAHSCSSSICLIGRRVPLVISLVLACCPTRGEGLMPGEATSYRKQSRKRSRTETVMDISRGRSLHGLVIQRRKRSPEIPASMISHSQLKVNLGRRAQPQLDVCNPRIMNRV